MALKFQGSYLEVEDPDNPGVFVVVGLVTSYNNNRNPAPENDVSHSLSTEREYDLGLADKGGSWELGLWWHPDGDAGQKIVEAIDGAEAFTNFKWYFPNGRIHAVSAKVQNFPFNGQVDGHYTGTLTLRLAGAPTITYPS